MTQFSYLLLPSTVVRTTSNVRIEEHHCRSKETGCANESGDGLKEEQGKGRIRIGKAGEANSEWRPHSTHWFNSESLGHCLERSFVYECERRWLWKFESRRFWNPVVWFLTVCITSHRKSGVWAFTVVYWRDPLLCSQLGLEVWSYLRKKVCYVCTQRYL